MQIISRPVADVRPRRSAVDDRLGQRVMAVREWQLPREPAAVCLGKCLPLGTFFQRTSVYKYFSKVL